MASLVSLDLELIWNLTALREVESAGSSKVVERWEKALKSSKAQHLPNSWKAGRGESPASWRSRNGENSIAIAAQASALHPQDCQNQQLIPPASWADSSQQWAPRRLPYCIPRTKVTWCSPNALKSTHWVLQSPRAYSKFEIKSISQIASTTSCHYRMMQSELRSSSLTRDGSEARTMGRPLYTGEFLMFLISSK